MKLLDRIISARPGFHERETELQRPFEPGESLLPGGSARKLATSDLTCYGLGEAALRFIADNVGKGSRTLETGAGCSTLVFALQKAEHTAVTPSRKEIGRIREYAGENGIGLETVRFVPETSEAYLPRCDHSDLDLVLIDGKHAFPWPMLDWFFTAERLKLGGWMLLDDTRMRSVSVLAEFLSVDTGWEKARDWGKTLAFRKIRDKVLDVAWHMQPWTIGARSGRAGGIFRKIHERLGGMRRER